jgi:hypothetical protein
VQMTTLDATRFETVGSIVPGATVLPDAAEIGKPHHEDIATASLLVGRRVARVVANGEFEEGLVVCHDGAKRWVVIFPRGQEILAEEKVRYIP